MRLEVVRAARARRQGASARSRSCAARSTIAPQSVRAEAMRLLAGGAGGGARDVLPTFEAMLHGGDRVGARGGGRRHRRAARPGRGRDSAARRGARRSAANRCAPRRRGRSAGWRRASPSGSRRVLERAVRDPAYDVRERRAARRWRSPGRSSSTRASSAACWSPRTPTARAASWRSRRWSALAQRPAAPAAERAAARTRAGSRRRVRTGAGPPGRAHRHELHRRAPGRAARLHRTPVRRLTRSSAAGTGRGRGRRRCHPSLQMISRP